MRDQRHPASDGDLAWALHRLAADWSAADVTLARSLGVPPGDLALRHVANATDMGPAELSRLVGMSTGSVNALINRLVAAGHLTRRPHPIDRQRLRLALTPRTRDFLFSHYRRQLARFTDTGPLFDPAERAAILRFLNHPAWRTLDPGQVPTEGLEGAAGRDGHGPGGIPRQRRADCRAQAHRHREIPTV